MSRKTYIRFECDVPFCRAFIEGPTGVLSPTLPDAWETRAEGKHVCPTHVNWTSDEILEANDE